jgi:hypothetical protein
VQQGSGPICRRHEAPEGASCVCRFGGFPRSSPLDHGDNGPLALVAMSRHHLVMGWRRQSGATLDDVVELLEGIGTILMEISAKLEVIIRHVRGDEDEEADS